LRYFNSILVFLLGLAWGAAWPTATSAQAPAREVRVGIIDVEPINFLDETGQPQGLFVDLVDEIARREGWQVEYVPGSWAEGLQRGIDGNLDLLTSIMPTPERDRVLDFSSQSVLTIWGQVFVRPGSPVETILDLAFARVAVMKNDLNGTNFLDTMEKFGLSCTTVEVTSHHDVFRLVQSGQVEGGVAPNIFAEGNTATYDLLPTSILFSPSGSVFAVPEGVNGDLLTTIDRYLAEWKADRASYYYQRLDHWFGGSQYESRGLPSWVRWALGVALMVFLLLILWTWTLNHQVKVRTAELKTNEAKTRAIFDQTNQFIGVLDAQGTVLDINETALQFINASLEDVVGRPFWECPWWSHSSEAQQAVRDGIHIALTGEVFRNTAIHVGLSGEPHVVDFSLKPIFNEAGDVVQIIPEGRDITDSYEANRQLARLGMAIEHTTDVVILMDMDGLVEYVNPAFSEITGYSRDDALGRNLEYLRSELHDDRFWAELWIDLMSGKVWHGLIANRRKDGEIYRADMTVSPILNEDGRPMALVCIQRDMTEIERLEGELRQAQKLEAVGTLAGGIAHDFNNILTAIVGYNELAMMDAEGQPDLMENLKAAGVAADRARTLVQQILTFSRRSDVEKVPVVPARILTEAVKLLRSTIPTTIEFRERITSQRTVLADPTQIHQIVMNLATNAFHAMEEDGGVLGISLGDILVREEDPVLGTKVTPGDYVVMEISDTGEGMDARTREKIFEPYFTSKSSGKGTGLGLAVVHGIVRSFDGHITVYSEPGQGASFHVYLPVVSLEGQDSPAVQISEESLGGQEHILFVDDEADLVSLARKYFGSTGYRVSAFTNSRKALEAFRASPETFDIIITDQTMPRLTGVELATAVHETVPGFPVILCTGFSKVVSREIAGSNGITRYVQKPVVMSRLAGLVREILDA